MSTILLPFRWLFKASRVALFVVFLAVFVASHTIAAFTTMVSAAIEAVSGIQTVAGALSSSLKVEKDEAKAAKRKTLELEEKSRRLAIDKDELKAKNVVLSKDVEDLKRKVPPDVRWKGKKMPLKDAVSEMTGSVKKRTAKVAAANVGSVFGESVPVYGVAVIVGVTAYELKSSCDTMKDMEELTSQIDPNFDADDETAEVCGLKVPTKDEIVEMLKNSPELAWTAAQTAYEGAADLVPSWEQVQSIPGSVWNGILDAGAASGSWIADGSAAAWDWTSETGAAAVDGIGNAGAATWEDAKKFWNQ